MPDANAWAIVIVVVTGVVMAPILFGLFLMGIEVVVEELDNLAYTLGRMKGRHGK